MDTQQDAGVGAVVDDPDQQGGGDEAATLAATLEGGGSWYWTSMLNFSQSGSSSTHTSAGQLAASQFTGSPPSSSSVHNNTNSNINPSNNNSNNMNNNNNINQVVDHPLDSMLGAASNSTTTTTTNNNNNNNNDPENALWGQDFLSGPIGESKPSMHACGDDGLQELLYPRTVRELLLDQSPGSWELLQQAAITKSFGFPLGPEDQLPPSQLHGLEMKPSHHVQGLHYSHDDRLSSSTASSTLSDSTEPHWPATQAQAGAAPARTCAMHVPHTTLLQQQFDNTRVKQEYPQLSSSTSPTSAGSTFGKPSLNPFLLQHQQQQHSLRLINPNHDPACSALMQLNEVAAMAAMQQQNHNNADVKPSRQLHSWPNSPSASAINMCRSSSSFELGGLPSPHAGSDHVNQLQLLNSMKPQLHAAHGQLNDNTGFPGSPNMPNLISHDATFFQPDPHHHHHHHLMQQAAALQAHHQHAATAGSLLNNPSLQFLNPQAVAFKKARSHLEGGLVNNVMEESKDMKDKSGSAHDDFNFKRPRVEPQHHQQQQQSTPGSTTSFKSQPVRKEKLGERITTLQQLVSPFGKTDTASVLLEAIGYIKFLQDQVQTLSSPYLKSTNNPTSQSGDKNQNGEEAKPDLRSKGLCLVPLSCTMQVANDNGADYWYGGAFR